MSDNSLDLSFIPISSLKNASRNVLSMLLNPCKVIPNDNGIPRDWRGLAHLSGISGEMIPAFLCSPDPTSGVLSQWSQNSVQIANLRRLQEYLQKLDRFDVVDDTRHLFESDAIDYINDSRSSSISSISPSMLPNTPEHDVLTVQDAYLSQQGLSNPQFYDAFVLFADEDIDFALELINRMEAFGFKLCVKDRDLLGGLSSQHSAMLRLISERCSRLIVIVSPAFLQSPANTFFIDFAQALGIEQRQRKIVPCLYKNCQLPPQLSYYFLLNYQRSGKLWNFWDKLRDSLRVTPTYLTSSQRATIHEIETDVRSLSMLPNNYQPSQRLAIASVPDSYKPQYAPAIAPLKLPTISITPSDTPVPISNNNYSPTLPIYFPPLGQATSLVDLNHSTVDNNTREPSLSFTNESGMCVSVSDITNLNSIGNSPKNERTKKSRWYQKLLIFNHSSRNLDPCEQNDTSMKKKKKWQLKKAVPVLAD